MSALSRASDTTTFLRLPSLPIYSNLTNTIPLCSFKFHINHRYRQRHSLISPHLLKTPNPFPTMAHSNNPRQGLSPILPPPPLFFFNLN
ncbi:hypothetical protein NC653_018665 [Populus alba x Populus x berolinensis]|uniref:Uncharacterized protein n=1 Tax=Populus alba x Populus x berolinensis TaxID=444605 RepID=A0AAD6QGY1_9ROSI|nr:hypothetical protein NC653_018665 [Populus alba x Populus x berolinensis]